MIKFVCPSCGERLSVPEQHGGRKGVCPTCQAVNRIPLKGFAETKPQAPIIARTAPASAQTPAAPIQRGALSIPALTGRAEEEPTPARPPAAAPGRPPIPDPPPQIFEQMPPFSAELPPIGASTTAVSEPGRELPAESLAPVAMPEPRPQLSAEAPSTAAVPGTPVAEPAVVQEQPAFLGALFPSVSAETAASKPPPPAVSTERFTSPTKVVPPPDEQAVLRSMRRTKQESTRADSFSAAQAPAARREFRLPKAVKIALLIVAALVIVASLYCGLLFALRMAVPAT